MSTSVAPKPRTRKPVTRTMHVEADPFKGGLVRITVDGKPTLYRTHRFDCAPVFGVYGFEFQKVTAEHHPDGDPYHLTVSSPDPATAAIACDCKGFQYHGRCKHASCLRVLMARGEV